MFSYKLLSKASFNINKKSVDEIFKIIHKIVNKTQNWVLNIVLINEDGIKKLNKDFRNIDKVTDVLSFHYFDDFWDINNDEIAWEIVLCEEKVVIQWKKYGLGTEKEFYKLIIHSVLHILWYDHETDNDYKTMSNFEKQIWTEVFEK